MQEVSRNTLYPQHNCFQKDSVTHLSKTKQEVHLKAVFNRFKWGIFMLYMHRFTYQYDRILQPTSERDKSHREIFQHEYENFLWHAQNKNTLTNVPCSTTATRILLGLRIRSQAAGWRSLRLWLSLREGEIWHEEDIWDLFTPRWNDPSLCTFYLPHWKCSPQKNEHFTYNYI